MRNYLLSILASLTLAAVSPLGAQSLPDDLQAISPESVPASACNFFSIANWPNWPPCPANVFGDSSLYYSPSVGAWAIFADDRELQSSRLLNGLMTDSGDGGYELDGVDYSTNHTDLILDIIALTNSVIEGITNRQALLSIRNTTNAVPYEILSSVSVSNPMSAWISEGVWIGRSNNTPANVPIGARTNQNFFRAKVFNGFSNGIPTNGELFLVLSSNSPIQGIVNGATNTLTNFFGNYAMARLPNTNGDILQTHSLNVGYSHDDGGTTNISDFPAQNITGLLGFSKTVSNLCLSSNLLTTLNVSGWPTLYDLECWHCTNMLIVNLTNCPKLNRACLEAIQGVNTIGITNTLDFSGCTHLAEIRAADNRFPNVVIDDASVSNIWHLCIHNNSLNQLPVNMNFSRFPALQELWIWDDYFQGPLILTQTNTPYLKSIEADGNYFAVVDAHGQTNLDHIYLYANTTLTNLNIAGCSNITKISAIDCALTTSAVDDILTKLDSFGKTKCNTTTNLVCNLYNQSYNYNQPPSAVGLAAAASLRNKGWIVFHVPVSTSNTSPLWFTNTSSTVSMQISAPNAVSVKWVWGNGTITTDTTNITTNLGGSYSNALIVDPASALIGFGVGCSAGTTLSGLGGLTNYPFLKELHLYQTGLNSLSLAGSANLVSIALAGTSPSTNVCHSWFTDLAAAQPVAIPCGNTQFGCGNLLHHFYFPLDPGTNGIPEAVSNLVRVGWTLEGY